MTVKNRVFGGKCTELLANFDQELYAWKMLQMSFQWADAMLLDRLPKSGMIVNGQLYAVDQISEHRTTERAGFVLPTPTARLPGSEPKYLSQWRREEIKDMRMCVGVKACQHYGIEKEQAIGEGLVLNPRFVEWMMGFPQGWTAPSTTESEKSD